MNNQSSIFITSFFEENIKKTQLSIIDLYFILWTPTILVTSVVLLPIRGATLAYFFALLSPMVVLFFLKDKKIKISYI